MQQLPFGGLGWCTGTEGHRGQSRRILSDIRRGHLVVHFRCSIAGTDSHPAEARRLLTWACVFVLVHLFITAMYGPSGLTYTEDGASPSTTVVSSFGFS